MDGLYDQLRIALHQVWRRRWLALGVAWGVAVLGWLVIALIPNSYEAKARLFVQMQSILPNQIGITHRRAQRADAAPEADPDLERESRSGRAPHRSQQPGRQRARPRRDRRRRCAQRSRSPPSPTACSRSRRPRTSPASPTARTRAPPRHRPGPDRHLQSSRTCPATGARPARRSQFLDEELAAARPRCSEAEQRRVEFEQRYLGCCPATGSIGERMDAARTELADLEQQIAAAQARSTRCAASSPRRRRPSPGVGGDSSGTASGQIAALEGQIAQNLARGWTESHPDVVAAARTRSRGCAPMPRSERSAAYRRHAQPVLRLAARDDGRARGAAAPPRPRGATSSSRTSASSPRASRPSPASPPSRSGSTATMTC